MVNFSSAIAVAFFASASVALPWNLQPHQPKGAALPTGGFPAPSGGFGLSKRWDLAGPTGTGGFPAPTGGLNKRWDLAPKHGHGGAAPSGGFPAPTGGLNKRWDLQPKHGHGGAAPSGGFPAPTGGFDKRWNLIPTGTGGIPGPTGDAAPAEKRWEIPAKQFGGARRANFEPVFPVPDPGELVPNPTGTGAAPWPTAT